MRARSVQFSAPGPRASLLALYLCVLIVAGFVPLLLDLGNLDNTYYGPKARALVVLTPAIVLALVGHALSMRAVDRTAIITVGSFAVAAAAATLLSVDPSWSLRGAPWRSEGLVAYLGYAVVFLGALTLASSGRASGWQTAAIAGATVTAIYGIAQYFGYEWLVRDRQRVDWFQAFATSGHPNFLGAYMVLIFPLAACALFTARRASTAVFSLAASGLIFLAALCTYSRAAWAALVVGSALSGILLWRFRHGISRLRVVVLATIIAILTIMFMLPRGPFASRAPDMTPFVRARSVVEFQSPSIQTRPYLWRKTLDLLRSRPLLGYGPETLPLVFPQTWDGEKRRLFGEFPLTIDKAHNDTLDLAISIGLIGLLAFWRVLVLVLRRGLHAARQRGPQAILAVALISGIAAYWFDLQFQFSVVSVAPVFWSALGTAAGLGRAGLPANVGDCS